MSFLLNVTHVSFFSRAQRGSGDDYDNVIHPSDSNLLLSKRFVQLIRPFTLSARYGVMPVGGDKSVCLLLLSESLSHLLN